jgi:hypothetical protein
VSILILSFGYVTDLGRVRDDCKGNFVPAALSEEPAIGYRVEEDVKDIEAEIGHTEKQ